MQKVHPFELQSAFHLHNAGYIDWIYHEKLYYQRRKIAVPPLMKWIWVLINHKKYFSSLNIRKMVSALCPCRDLSPPRAGQVAATNFHRSRCTAF